MLGVIGGGFGAAGSVRCLRKPVSTLAPIIPFFGTGGELRDPGDTDRLNPGDMERLEGTVFKCESTNLTEEKRNAPESLVLLRFILFRIPTTLRRRSQIQRY